MSARTGQDLAARKNQKVMVVQMAERGDTLFSKVGHWAEKNGRMLKSEKKDTCPGQ